MLGSTNRMFFDLRPVRKNDFFVCVGMQVLARLQIIPCTRPWLKVVTNRLCYLSILRSIDLRTVARITEQGRVSSNKRVGGQ